MVGFFRVEEKCVKRILCVGVVRGGKVTIKTSNDKERTKDV